ncbi:hypothetical protein, partial [Nonomuraea sp. NPDC003201]
MNKYPPFTRFETGAASAGVREQLARLRHRRRSEAILGHGPAGDRARHPPEHPSTWPPSGRVVDFHTLGPTATPGPCPGVAPESRHPAG